MLQSQALGIRFWSILLCLCEHTKLLCPLPPHLQMKSLMGILHTGVERQWGVNLHRSLQVGNGWHFTLQPLPCLSTESCFWLSFQFTADSSSQSFLRCTISSDFKQGLSCYRKLLWFSSPWFLITISSLQMRRLAIWNLSDLPKTTQRTKP